MPNHSLTQLHSRESGDWLCDLLRPRFLLSAIKLRAQTITGEMSSASWKGTSRKSDTTILFAAAHCFGCSKAVDGPHDEDSQPNGMAPDLDIKRFTIRTLTERFYKSSPFCRFGSWSFVSSVVQDFPIQQPLKLTKKDGLPRRLRSTHKQYCTLKLLQRFNR